MDMSTAVFQVLDASRCRELLASEHVGRLAYIADDAPVIVPVDYAMFEGCLVFRTDRGDKYAHVPLQRVCFEVDRHDEDATWSVIVRGHARDVTTAMSDHFNRMRKLRMHSAAPLHDPHWISIDLDEISGRWFGN